KFRLGVFGVLVVWKGVTAKSRLSLLPVKCGRRQAGSIRCALADSAQLRKAGCVTVFVAQPVFKNFLITAVSGNGLQAFGQCAARAAIDESATLILTRFIRKLDLPDQRAIGVVPGNFRWPVFAQFNRFAANLAAGGAVFEFDGIAEAIFNFADQPDQRNIGALGLESGATLPVGADQAGLVQHLETFRARCRIAAPGFHFLETLDFGAVIARGAGHFY